MSLTRVSHLTVALEDFGLAARAPAAGRRLTLTDRGLALLARRDRASVGIARKRWSATPTDAGNWHQVSGRRGRQLLRNLDHTAAVHAFMAALARQARTAGWEAVQLDPPHRASRYFRYGDRPAGWGGTRSVHPDGFGLLRRREANWPFFLEWERRAVRPTTMAAPPGPLPALLRLPPPHRRPRRPTRCARRLPRRTGGEPLSARGGGGDGARPGRGAPLGLARAPAPAGGATGASLAQPHRRRARSGTARRLNT